MCVKRFDGKVYFSKPKSAHNVNEAVLKPDGSMLVEFIDEEGWDCTASLERVGSSPNFTGRWKARKGDDITNGDAECTVYENSEGYLFFGRWKKRAAEVFVSNLADLFFFLRTSRHSVQLTN